MISFIVFLAILDASTSQLLRQPDCGRVTPQADPLVVGGARARHGELPWHVGVYQKTSRPYRQICGGSIVSRKLVISAAHCFWNPSEKLTPASRYAVAAGKIYKPWDESHDPDAQHSNVSELVIPSLFRGVDRNFAEDLALLVLQRSFEYRPYLRPVCLDFGSRLEERQLQAGNKGKVAGWGLTSADGKKTAVLNVIDLPFVTTEVCLQKSPKSYWEYITIDKICAGYDTGQATLCQGDSGGGLVFPYTTEPGVERYYLRGVVSTSPSSASQCNAFAITSFTKISAHRKFIELRYRQETVEGSLPLNIYRGSPTTKLPGTNSSAASLLRRTSPTSIYPKRLQNETGSSSNAAAVQRRQNENRIRDRANMLREEFASKWNSSQFDQLQHPKFLNRNFSINDATPPRTLDQIRSSQFKPRTTTEQTLFLNRLNQRTQNSPKSDLISSFRTPEDLIQEAENLNRHGAQRDNIDQTRILNEFNNRLKTQDARSVFQSEIDALRNQAQIRGSPDVSFNQFFGRNQAELENQEVPTMLNQNQGLFTPTRTEKFSSSKRVCVNGQCTEEEAGRRVTCVNGQCSASVNGLPSFPSITSTGFFD